MRGIKKKIVVLISLFFVVIVANSYAVTPEKNKVRNARLFAKANYAKNKGEIIQAVRIYQECLNLDPQDAAAMYELANIYLSSQKIEEAKKYALKANEIDPANSYYKILLSNIYLAEGNTENAIILLKELSRNFPGKTDLLRQLAYVLVVSNNFEEAIDVLDQLEKKMGVNEFISLQKQQLYLKLNKTDEAIVEIEKLIEQNPFEVNYYGLLAELCVKNNKDDKALWAYEQIAKIDPDDAYIHLSLFDFYRKRENDEKAFEELKLAFANPTLSFEPKIQVLLSYYTTEEIYTTKTDKARELVWILEETHPDNTRAMTLKADLLYRSKEYAEARKVLHKVLAKDDSQYSWNELLLIVETDSQNWDTVVSLSSKIIKMFPIEPLPYLISGLGNIQLENYEQAEKRLEAGVNLVNNNPNLKAQFYSYLGDIYHQLENISKSDQAYENALKYDTANSMVLNNYAYYLAIRGEKLEKADWMSKKAIELDPENSSNLDTRAWVLYKMERYEAALIYIEKAASIDKTQSVELLEHYGDILYKLGEKNKAVKKWKKARDLGGGSEYLEQKINEKKIIE